MTAVVQGVFFVLAATLCILARVPWVAIALLLPLAAVSAAAWFNSAAAHIRNGVVGACTALFLLTVLVGGLSSGRLESYLDSYYVAVSGLLALGILLGRRRDPGCARAQDMLGLSWAVLAVVLWLAVAYTNNSRGWFYAGLAGALGLGVLWHWRFRPAGTSFHLLNCALSIMVGLGLADLVVGSVKRLETDTRVRQSYYAYESARKDPAAFARWWRFYLAQWAEVEKVLYVPDPEGRLPYRLRPNSEARLCQSLIRINSRGLRGREISAEKGRAYRILVLGESTSFGITLNAEDRPWPELLERLVAERLHPARPVEVINGAVPGYTLPDNLHRLEAELLSLRPDMILTYHGINGFPMLNAALPSTRAANTAPAYRERALRILGNCEYKFRVAQFKRRQLNALKRPAPAVTAPTQTPYAAAYRNLCEFAATNHIRLVLATFSMAVNGRSPAEAVRFYQAGYPAASWLIEANAVHSQILRQVARECPEALLVDTAPRLDGVFEHYLDLVHFSPSGDRQMAETMFSGIESLLRSELEKENASAGWTR